MKIPYLRERWWNYFTIVVALTALIIGIVGVIQTPRGQGYTGWLVEIGLMTANILLAVYAIISYHEERKKLK